MALEPARLIHKLNLTGLKTSNAALYQLLYEMIGVVTGMNTSVNTLSSLGGGSTTIQQIIQQITIGDDSSGGDGGGDIGPPGVAGADGVNGMMPTSIASGETFTIPEDKQALFAMNIDNEGILEVLGHLIEVDGEEVGSTTTNYNNLMQLFHEEIIEETFQQILQNSSVINNISNVNMIQQFLAEQDIADEIPTRPIDSFVLPYWLISGTFNLATTTSTGTQADFAPGLRGNTLVRCNNASDLTISGLAGGYDGQLVTFASIGAGNVYFKHQNTGSVAANRFINTATSGDTPIAAGAGNITYQYDATTSRWRLISHTQGAYINVTYNAGDFTGNGAQTWTVDAGDVNTYAYYLSGKNLFLNVYISTTSVGGTPDVYLQVLLPNSYTLAKAGVAFSQAIDNGVTNVGLIDWSSGQTQIHFRNSLVIANWSASVNNSFVRTALFVEIN